MKQVEIEEILANVRAEVSQRRANGDYPPGLEQELEAEFAQIMSLTQRGINDKNQELDRLLADLRRKSDLITGLTPVDSQIPGISLFHRITRRVIARHTMGLAQQIRDSEETLLAIVRLLANQAKSQEEADKRMVAALSKHVIDRISVVDHLTFMVQELELRIRKFETDS